MRNVTFTVWPNVRAARNPGEPITQPWSSWVNEFLQHAYRGPAPVPDDCKAISKLNHHKGGRCYVPGEVDGNRNANAVKAIHAATLDLDSVPEDKLVVAFRAIAPYAAAVYTTHKHGFQGATKLRVVLPLKEPIPPQRYAAFWHGLNAAIGGVNDKSTKSPQLPFYFPSTWIGSTVAEAWEQRGDWMDAEHYMAVAPAAPAAGAATAADGSAATGRALSLLRRMPKDHDLRAAATAVMRGESFAEPGERHNTMLRLTGWMAFKSTFRPFSGETIAAVFAPSLAAMMVEDPTLEEDPAGAYATALEKAVVTAEHERAAEADAARNAQRPSGAGEYTDEDLERIAKAQGCTVRELSSRWIVQKGTSYYLLNERGSYAGPFIKDEVAAALHQELARSPVRLIDWTERGPRDRKPSDIIKEHGKIAARLVADFTLQTTRFDPATLTLREAVCPLRPLAPAYDEEIETWLTLLAGPQAGKLFDWMACAPDLSKLLCALYFCGSKSAGKTLFAHGMASLWTDGAPTSAAEVFASDFNESILSCPLVFADETLPKQHKGMNVTEMLRGLLTTSNRKIRRKYQATGDAAGTLRVVLAANNEYLLSASSMTADDIEAVAEKVLFIDAPGDRSREYLDGLRAESPDKLDTWRRTGIAGFALWLQANRMVLPESRFWVSGTMGRMLRNLLTTTGWNSRVCEFLARYLDTPKALDSKGTGLVRILDGELLVNVRGIVDGWTAYMPEPRYEMETSKISAALRSIAKGTAVKRWKNKTNRYHVVELNNLIAWSERHQVGEPAAMRANLMRVAEDAAEGESVAEQLNQPEARHGLRS